MNLGSWRPNIGMQPEKLQEGPSSPFLHTDNQRSWHSFLPGQIASRRQDCPGVIPTPNGAGHDDGRLANVRRINVGFHRVRRYTTRVHGRRDVVIFNQKFSDVVVVSF